MKVKTLLHIGKIVCEATVIALGIAELCTPAAGVIAATAIGIVAFSLSLAEDCISDTILVCEGNGHAILEESNNSDTDSPSGDDTDSLQNCNNDLNATILNLNIDADDIVVSGDHSSIIVEV